MTLTIQFQRFLLLGLFLVVTGCKKEEPKIEITDDKVYSDQQGEIAALEIRKDSLVKQNSKIDEKVSSLSVSSKISELLRKQKQSVNQSIIFLEQTINYLKIKSLVRKKYILDNQGIIKKEDLDRQYKEYLLDKEANPNKKPWESEKLSPLLTDEKKEEPAKKPSGH